MAKSKLVSANEKIADEVVKDYKKIEKGVVGTYQKIEDGVINKFNEISDSFVDAFLTKEGESVEDAKARLAQKKKEKKDRKGW